MEPYSGMSASERAATTAAACHLRLSQVLIGLARELPSAQVQHVREQMEIVRAAIESMQSVIAADLAIKRAQKFGP